MMESSINESVFMCGKCSYFRQVVSGREGKRLYDHMIYGSISYREAAEKEIAHHDCEVYAIRLEAVRRIMAEMKTKIEIGIIRG